MKQPIAYLYSARDSDPGLAQIVEQHLPDIEPRSILVKPNWVFHEENVQFPIRALVTSRAVVAATVRACIAKYPRAEEIIIADAPLQSCDWEKLSEQAGISDIERTFAPLKSPVVTVCDLRHARYHTENGFLTPTTSGAFGDPRGYRLIDLGARSFLEPVTGRRSRFRVSDYDSRLTRQHHARGAHHYLVSGSVLHADLIVNLPKMKTHQKAGITGALKNIVGCNGEKAYLAHFRQGWGRRGDEFSPGTPWAVRAQVRIRERLQKRSRRWFAAGRRVWRVIRQLEGIEVEGTPQNLGRRFYQAGGAWHGNDTIWRMVYDLNNIIRYADDKGVMRDQPQRSYITIMDGITAGEGNGPLQPLPVELETLIISDDPFVADSLMARLMGFDAQAIPLLSHHRECDPQGWGQFSTSDIRVIENGGAETPLANLEPRHHFIPPPGWRGHIELR